MVSPLSRESTVGTLKARVFREIRDLIPFHVVLNVIPVCFKIFIIISLFAFVHKGGE